MAAAAGRVRALRLGVWSPWEVLPHELRSLATGTTRARCQQGSVSACSVELLVVRRGVPAGQVGDAVVHRIR